MSQQPPPPLSPGLSRTLYSGMSSLQIRQPGAGHNTGAPALSVTSPPKAVFKSSKAEHAHRPNRRDHRSSIVLGWDHHQAAAAAGRKRIMDDDAQFLASQYFWRPFPREMRPETQKETVNFLGALVNAFEKQAFNTETALDEPNRLLTAVEAKHADTAQAITRLKEDSLRARDEQENLILELLELSPNEEFRQICLNHLASHYATRRRMDEMWRQANQ